MPNQKQQQRQGGADLRFPAALEACTFAWMGYGHWYPKGREVTTLAQRHYLVRLVLTVRDSHPALPDALDALVARLNELNVVTAYGGQAAEPSRVLPWLRQVWHRMGWT